MRARHLLHRGLEALSRPLYAGSRYECPLCEGRSRALKPFGLELPVVAEKRVVGAGRRRCACPWCGSLDRERLVYLYLRDYTRLFEQPAQLLHVAPETRLGARLRDPPNLDYLSADLEMDTAARRIDVTAIDLPAASFDAIICNHVLEHVPDDERAMRELRRVLRPGGFAILQVPISLALPTTHEDPSVTEPAERERLFAQRDHVRLYSEEDYVQRLRRAGFAVEVFDWTRVPALAGRSGNRFGLSFEERVYVARPADGEDARPPS